MIPKQICDMLCGKEGDTAKHLDLALLLIRLSVAATFIVHGWQKIGNMEGTIGFFASLGFAAGLAHFVAWAEFLGGIMLAIGGATRLVGALFAAIMVVAIYAVHMQNGFNNSGGGYEFQLLLLACSVGLALVGPGKLSLHKKFCAK